MLLPSKVTSFRESIFPNALIILRILSDSDKSIVELRQACRSLIPDTSDFFVLLDFLFAVGKIELNPETEELHYVA